MAKRSRSTPAITPVAPVVAAPVVAVVSKSKPDSIRSTIRAALLAGVSTKDLTVTLQEKFPGTAAATKSTKHIAFYRSKMRKAGELAPAKDAAAAVSA